ncbi:ABC transporter ATP-binding protein [Hymenobacter norwichensis]|uniref:ABC transporter ATP-binding protein n=1 Tax=Hymenobacter norwichensis TaxID=223903 RepID=UPI0003B3D1D7|nr:ATP-binding cassette domain-containing protein [Hymenobacter norwichensis]
MLHLSNFRKTYQQQVVLQVEALTIPAGVYWLRGRNGAGKSTLLKALAGMISFEGNITLQPNVNLKQHPVVYRRLVNFAEAEPVFPAFLTGTELINLFKVAKGASRQQEALYVESMQMGSYVHEPVRSYSSGMLKKLSLVLAFLGQPTCILLDEPLTTLDTESLPVLYSWISHHFQQHGTLFLLSSHQVFTGGFLPPVQQLCVAQQTVQHCA